MQSESGDFSLSPVTPRSSHGHRRPDNFTTRRLSAAIDALRREGEAILWELNSLKTQNSTLEQRILGQAEELDMIARGLATLREQHRIMEQQYQEKLRALRCELRAVQDSTSDRSINASASARERCRSPSSPDSPQLFGNQRSLQHTVPQPPHLLTSLIPVTQVPTIPISHRDHARDMAKELDVLETAPSRVHSAALRHSSTPSPSRPTTSLQSSSGHSPYFPQHRLPRGIHVQTRARSNPDQSDNIASPGTRHEPSLSPTTTLVGSDAPSRPRSRKARS